MYSMSLPSRRDDSSIRVSEEMRQSVPIFETQELFGLLSARYLHCLHHLRLRYPYFLLKVATEGYQLGLVSLNVANAVVELVHLESILGFL